MPSRPKCSAQPHFCSGCPHNTSTRVPEGSRAVGGIGCHYMAAWMDRDTVTFTQMGGEGAHVDRPGAVHRHEARVPEPRRRHLRALGHPRDPRGRRGRREHDLQDPVQRRGRDDRRSARRGAPDRGARRAAARGRGRAAGHGRDERCRRSTPRCAICRPASSCTTGASSTCSQRELRDVAGVSALIYDQTCAAELHRKRKRGLVPDARQARRDQRARVRGLRRLQRAIELPLRHGARDRVRPQAPHQPVVVQPGLQLPRRLLSELRHAARREAQSAAAARAASRAAELAGAEAGRRSTPCTTS